jgi:hypothetical protein
MKTIFRVLVEAICIGAVLALMIYLIMMFVPKTRILIAVTAFVCGALFHIVCQLTGVNDWYVRTYSF